VSLIVESDITNFGTVGPWTVQNVGYIYWHLTVTPPVQYTPYATTPTNITKLGWLALAIDSSGDTSSPGTIVARSIKFLNFSDGIYQVETIEQWADRLIFGLMPWVTLHVWVETP
jgi:hypothetical protein